VSPLGAVRSPLLALTLLVLTGLGALAPAYAANDGTDTVASIDHAQPTADGVQMLVSVPASAGTVDYSKVAVTIGNHAVSSTAVAASSSNAIKRVSILAIDTSESMHGARIAEAKHAAKTYLATAPANVDIGVLTFDDNVRLLVKPGRDRAAELAAIDGLTLTRNTALYDGVLGALDAVGPAGDNAGQRRVLVLSDGHDTTKTSLSSVVSKISKSGVVLDAVALAQSDNESAPLREMAAAGKGQVLDAGQPTALSAAFAQEAQALSRQILVTAKVPASVGTSSDVSVSIPAASGSITAGAYLPVHAAVAPTVASATPTGVTLSGTVISERVVIGGVVAIAIGLLGIILALGMRKPDPDAKDWLDRQMQAYGANATTGPGTHEPPAPAPGFSGQARRAAEKALANNRSLEARLEARLDQAGMTLKPAEWLLVRAGVTVGAGMLGILIGAGNILLGLLFVVAGIIGPGLYLRLRRSRRLAAFGAGLADTLQLMSGSLSAGLSLAQSIDTIVKEGNEPIASEFRRVVIETRLGVGLEDSLEGVAQRMESRDWEWVVMAIRIQREVGGNLAELLLQVAETLREREFLRRHVKALSAEGRLSCYILGGLPPGFLVFLTLTKPDYVHPLYSTPLGFVLLSGIVVLLSVGIFWMAKVAKVDL
jgi:tight adherence protein B